MCEDDGKIKEVEKLELEKIKLEIKQISNTNIREWIVSASIVIGIGVTLISGFSTLSSISTKNNEQALKARIETTNLFLSKVLPAITDTDVASKNATKFGAYMAAVRLANDFPDLQKSVYVILKKNADNADENAQKALEFLSIKDLKGESK